MPTSSPTGLYCWLPAWVRGKVPAIAASTSTIGLKQNWNENFPLWCHHCLQTGWELGQYFANIIHICVWTFEPNFRNHVLRYLFTSSRPHKCYPTDVYVSWRKSKQNIRAAHFVYFAFGARSAPSDVGFAKDYKFRANSPPGADTWITGGGGCGPWCGLKEARKSQENRKDWNRKLLAEEITGGGGCGTWCGKPAGLFAFALHVSNIVLHAFGIFFKNLISHFYIWIKSIYMRGDKNLHQNLSSSQRIMYQGTHASLLST